MSTSRKLFGKLMMILLVIGLFLTACQGAEPSATPTPEPTYVVGGEKVLISAHSEYSFIMYKN